MSPEQILTKMSQMATQLTAISSELAHLHTLYTGIAQKTVDVDLVEATQTAAARFHVPARLMFSRTKTESVCVARYHAWTLLAERGWSYSAIARAFKRDHGTIIHGIHRYQDLQDTHTKLLTPIKQTLAA